jgi:hypothetical protein
MTIGAEAIAVRLEPGKVRRRATHLKVKVKRFQ